MNPTRVSVLATLLAVAIGCATSDPAPQAKKPPAVVYEVRFVSAGHELASCARGLESSLVDLPDGVAFFDPDSRLKIAFPDKSSQWHAHVIHRIGDGLHDTMASADKGALEIDLARLADPERLVIVSGSGCLKDNRATVPAPNRDAAVVPPYTLSLKLVARDKSAAMIAVQPFRYDLETPVAKAHLMVQPRTRGDMLLTLIDPAKKLHGVFGEAFFHHRAADTALVPKLTVAVLDAATRQPWQRVGVWPRPAALSGSAPIALRTPRRELLALDAPPSIELTAPADPPATDARLGVLAGPPRPGEVLKLVVAHALPDDRTGREFFFRVQTVDVAADENAVHVSLDGLDDMRFPITASIAHRLVSPVHEPGGLLRPVPPLASVVVPLGDDAALVPKNPKRVLAAARASHYDLLRFSGPLRITDAGVLAAIGSGDSSDGGFGDGGGGDGDPGPILIPGPGMTPGMRTPMTDDGDGTAGGASGFPPGAGPTSGDDDGPGGPPVGDVTVKLKCGCKMAGECKCKPHMWSSDAIMQCIARYRIVTPSGQVVQAADLHWAGSHGASAPCHTKHHVGMLRISVWMGMTLVERTYNVYVLFTPCSVLPEDPGDEPFDFDIGIALPPGAGGGALVPFNEPALTGRVALFGGDSSPGPLRLLPTRLLRRDPLARGSDAYLKRLQSESGGRGADDGRRSPADDWGSIMPGASDGRQIDPGQQPHPK